ncbi:MAG TPA: hypothetical protein VFR97_01655 [Capillimicrobium sp.]|nr:hypothetical protein [Capillimicrobium sp.]
MGMTTRELRDLLRDVPDTREIVIRPQHPAGDALAAAWRAAEEDATRALEAWRAHPGREAFAAFRAAQDRADAAQDALVDR